MSQALLTSSYLSYCENLHSIHHNSWYKPEFESFDAFAASLSLSKARAKLIINFVNFRLMAENEGMRMPTSPEQVRSLLSMPRKRWLEIWELVLDCVPVV